jgi:hypothetical protein
MGFSFLWAHEFEKCLECANQAKALALERKYNDLLALSLFVSGCTFSFTGKVVESIRDFEEALTHSKEAGDYSTEAFVLMGLGLVSKASLRSCASRSVIGW